MKEPKRKGIADWLRDYYFMREEIDKVQQRKIDCVRNQQFEFAAAFRDKEKKLLRRYKSLRVKINPIYEDTSILKKRQLNSQYNKKNNGV